MFATAHSLYCALALSFLLLPASARVMWIPEEFDTHENHLQPRDAGTCGGDSSLTYCGGGMPSGFCCSSGFTCLALNTSASVTAAMCCPQGSDCAQINPISCDTSLQNTTITQLHADPPQKLKSCGDACCPMGYGCDNGQCVAHVKPTALTSAATSTSSTSSRTSAATTSSSSDSSTSPSPSPTAAGSVAAHSADPSSSSDSDFNGKSFAAGFVPGIAIGAFIAAVLLLLLFRKRRRESESYVDEKGHARDTLTDLGPLEYRRPNMHGRSISEPHADPTAGHRTDFLRSTPPRAVDGAGGAASGYVVDVRSPASASPPRVKALFSRSPFMPQYPSTPPSVHPPMPAHLKRGTLSFKISPIRVLKKQKSMHSLRRQMTDASGGEPTSRSDSRWRPRPDRSRSGSTETIQVLMPNNEPYTPERPVEMPEHIQTLASATYQPPSSSSNSTWRSRSDDSPTDPQPPYASSSRYPSEMQQTYTTPTRPPMPRVPTEMTLGSPYTPTNHVGAGRGNVALGGGLGVKRETSRRDTTFSAMMERAGLRKSDLMMGSGR